MPEMGDIPDTSTHGQQREGELANQSNWLAMVNSLRITQYTSNVSGHHQQQPIQRLHY